MRHCYVHCDLFMNEAPLIKISISWNCQLFIVLILMLLSHLYKLKTTSDLVNINLEYVGP